MAFRIERNGIALKLNDGAVLSTTLHNNLTSGGILSGTYTIPLDIPIKGNEQFFDFSDSLKLVNAYQILKAGFDNVKVYVEGIRWLYGKINVLRINEKTLSINLVVGVPSLSAMDKKLQELGWDTITLPSHIDPPTEINLKLAYFKTRMEGEYDETIVGKTFNFPMIKNPTYYGDSNTNNADYLGFMNAYFNDSYKSNIYGNYNAIVPMVYILEILRKGFLFSGYKFDVSNLSGDYRKLMAISNYDLVKMRNSFGIKAYNNSSVSAIDNSGSDFIIQYDNDSPIDGFWDNSGLWDTSTSEYTIQRPGRYLIMLRNLSWVALDYAPLTGTGVLAVMCQVQNGIIDSQAATRNNLAATNIEYIEFYVDVLEDGTLNGVNVIGEKIRINLAYTDPANPSNTALVGAASTIEIINQTRPQLNYFADEIDLSKCVPQDVLFKDYVAAVAATWNVFYDVDDIRKIITIRKNETGIASNPVINDAIWKSNDIKEVVDIRTPKYKDMAYSWGGNDLLVGSDNFKLFDSSEYLGEVPRWSDLISTFVAGWAYLNKKGGVQSEARYYICQFDGNNYDWVFFSYYFNVNLPIGEGTDTLSLPMSPLMMTHFYMDELFTMPIPEISIEADSILFNSTEKDIGLRMILYIGSCSIPVMVGGATYMPYSTNNTSFYYPLSDPFHPHSPEFSMEYDRDYAGTQLGMIDKWKNTIRVLNLTRRATKKFSISFYELLNFSFAFRTAMLGVVFMPEQLTVFTKIDQTGISVEGEFGIEEVEKA